MPDFPIIDAHVHLYDVQRLRYGWLAGAPRINKSHLLADFDTARGPVKIEKFVFAEVAVDAGLHLDEARFVQEIANTDKRLAGMVAHLPVEQGRAIAADLETLQQLPALRGIRRLMQTEVDQAFALQPGFIDGVKLVGRAGLVFDFCVRHWGLVYCIEVARRCPDMQFVLDHIGKPDIKNGLREPWWSQIAELARLANVACKLSGVATEADHAKWTEAEIVPYVAHAIDCFGFDRVMFASDWPVAELTHRYPGWVAILDRVTAKASADEKRKLFRDTAARVYRL